MLGEKRRMIEMSGPLHVVEADRHGYTARDDDEGTEELADPQAGPAHCSACATVTDTTSPRCPSRSSASSSSTCACENASERVLARRARTGARCSRPHPARQL